LVSGFKPQIGMGAKPALKPIKLKKQGLFCVIWPICLTNMEFMQKSGWLSNGLDLRCFSEILPYFCTSWKINCFALFTN
jgi:hypothetical protein